jgi:DNA adenine methylase
MTFNKMTPFLKWSGGKGQLVERLFARLPKKYNSYYEPFVGAGALFFFIAPKNRAVINDIRKIYINSIKKMKLSGRYMKNLKILQKMF